MQQHGDAWNQVGPVTLTPPFLRGQGSSHCLATPGPLSWQDRKVLPVPRHSGKPSPPSIPAQRLPQGTPGTSSLPSVKAPPKMSHAEAEDNLLTRRIQLVIFFLSLHLSPPPICPNPSDLNA